MSGVVPLAQNLAASSDRSAELALLEAPLRRYVQSRVRDRGQADDIVQETLLRTWEAAGRLEIETLTAYAIVVARNEIRSLARSEMVARRHLPKLVDVGQPPRPDDAVAAAESRQALLTALESLPARSRQLLVAHDLHEQPLARIAAEERVRPGSLATQLHRTRARLRVDYVLALRRVTPPTTRCRSVLMAISAGDVRRQRALSAGDHLADCPVCEQVAVPLLSRDRSLAGLLPWMALGAPQGVVEGWARRHPRVSTATAAAVVAAGALAAVMLGGAARSAQVTAVPAASTVSVPAPQSPAPSTADPSSTTPTTPSTPVGAPPTSTVVPQPAVPGLTAAGQPVLAGRDQLGSLGAVPVQASGVLVLTVPGDEGFWVGSDAARMWVEMTGPSESPLHVVPGMRLSFQANLVANGATFVDDLALKGADDRNALKALGVHLTVPNTNLTVVR